MCLREGDCLISSVGKTGSLSLVTYGISKESSELHMERLWKTGSKVHAYAFIVW